MLFRQKYYYFMVSLLLFFSSGASSQVLDACVQVYSNSVRNVQLETRSRSERSFYFNLYCEKSGEMKSGSFVGSAGFPIEGIPIEMSSDGKWNESELKEFCKTGSENRYYSSNSLSYGNFVTTDSLASFNECVRLGAKDLVMTHSEAAPFGVTINGRLTTATANIDIDGIVFDKDKLACFSPSFSSDKITKPIDGSRGFKITGNFAINCLRQPLVNGSKRYFPPTAITISTTDGPYTVRLREDTYLGFNLASEAQAAYDSVVARANQMQSERDVANANAAHHQSRAQGATTRILYQGDRPQNWHHDQYVGCPHQNGHVVTNADINATCLPGTTARTSVRLTSSPGRGCNHTFWAVTCVPN